MPIQFRCQYCRQLLGISDSRAGTVVDCPACGRSLRVPTSDGAPARPEPIKLPDSDPGFLDALRELSGAGSATGAKSEAVKPTARTGSPKPRVAATGPAKKSPTSSVPPRGLAEAPPAGLISPELMQELAELPPFEELSPAVIPELTDPELLDEPSDSVDPPSEPVPQRISATNSAAATDSSLASHLSALQELAQQAPVAIDPSKQTVTPNQARSSRPFLAALIPGLIVVSGFAGYLIGRSTATGDASSSAERSAPATSTSPDAPGHPATVADSTDATIKVTGVVTWKDDSGQMQPDSDALVLLLPVENASGVTFDARPLRDSADSVSHRSVAAGLYVLGASITRADASGAFSLSRSNNGPRLLVVISQHRSRPSDQPTSATVTDQLAKWFMSPAHLLGRLDAQTIGVPATTENTAIKVEFPTAREAGG